MNFIRNVRSRLGLPKNRWIINHGSDDQNDARKNSFSQENSKKRSRDSYEDYDGHYRAKNPRLDESCVQYAITQPHYDAREHSFSDENCKKRRRDSGDDDGDYYQAKKTRLNDASVQYAIKQPSQYANPNRKILETLFDSDITAEGWRKKSTGFEYHTQIRETCFYDTGRSIDSAREHVAERALKVLCNFKSETVCWPNDLLQFRLNQTFADEIGRMVQTKYDEIMQTHFKYKPNKVRAGIVMTTDGMSLENAKVVAIGTGTKCLSTINDDQHGIILHDMHAEVLARRCFVRFLYDQIKAMLHKKSSIFQWEGKEIQLKEGVKFHLYVNAIPCGDARVFSLKGLAHVKNESKMGSLRIKQIGSTEQISENTYRTTSMSCSDKIARWNVLGLQGSSLSKYIQPIYLESIILGSAYSPKHLHRAISGRLDTALTDLPTGYYLNHPKFESTSLIETTDNFVSSTDYGVCWNNVSGYENAPEIINLHTGLNINQRESTVSKLAFLEMFNVINEKIAVQSAEGITKFRIAKEKFYAALKKKNFGAWERCPV